MPTFLTRSCVVPLALVLAAACAREQPPSQGEAELMEQGVAQLYTSQNPVAAESTFRSVLRANPTHYGARYQLAVALDRGGKPADARMEWNEVLKLAQAANDSNTLNAARARLAAPDTASEAALMALGVDLLHRQNDPAAAIPEFQRVLQRNATHYGATYQLATALDRANRAAEARPLWQKVVGMATTYRDTVTLRTARARLAAP